MLCELCASMGRARLPRTSGEMRALIAPSESPQVCECCDRPVPAGVRARFVAVISRLARFGLTGQSLMVKKHV